MTIDDEARALAKRLATKTLPQRPVVIYGSSTVWMWPEPEADTGRRDIVPVGFGGATLKDCCKWYDVLVRPIGPHALVIAAGANDLEKGDVDIDDVLDRLHALIHTARESSADLPILVLTLKPAPFHAPRMAKLAEGNRRLIDRARDWPDVTVVDTFGPFLDASGTPDATYYAEDQRHLNTAGYRLWSTVIRDALIARGL